MLPDRIKVLIKMIVRNLPFISIVKDFSWFFTLSHPQTSDKYYPF